VNRPRCSVFVATSLDGFIARRNGGIEWLAAVERPGEDYGFQTFFDGVDALVVGAATYRVALGLEGPWPWADKRVVVLTHRPPPAPRVDETFFAGDPAALVESLGAEGVRRLYVDGGAVISQFLAAGLVDDLTISVLPVLLGDGVRLFQGTLPERRLALVSSRAFPSGLVQGSYRLEGGEAG
jgi:dihydrofolate reductase